MRLLASFDRYPDSVSLLLEPIATDSQRFELYLTLQLQPQTQSLLEGQIRWGLKGGQLSLSSEGCSIEPIGSRAEDCHVTCLEALEGGRWRLSFKSPQSVFIGSIERIKLGAIEIQKEPYHLTTQFSVTPSDLCITETAGLWRHNISPNKQGVLERKLAFFLIEAQLDPYFSRISLGSIGVELDTVLINSPKMSPARLSQLRNTIEQIYESNSENFLELAKLANLDPLTDFTGANLLAVELSGIAIGGANFYQVNFRGANLTDADLSEVNANHASFKGADLSGALLANADLSYADFYRASLALVNLIGANLEGANLIETNVSQANFASARVKGAKFGNNAGMTAEMRESLIDRAAVFE